MLDILLQHQLGIASMEAVKYRGWEMNLHRQVDIGSGIVERSLCLRRG